MGVPNLSRDALIPRQVHRAWLGGSEPEWTRPFADTWRRPGWQLVEWNDDNVESLFPLHNQAVYDAAEEIAPNHVGQLRSDVLRYELLWRFGGIWVDTDSELLQPLDSLIDGLECFAAWEVQTQWIANGLMGSRPGHPFIWRLIDGLQRNVARESRSKPNRMTGPQYLTRTWRQHGETDGVAVLPQRLIYPYGYAEIADHGPGDEWPDAVVAHHWQNKRRERSIPVG